MDKSESERNERFNKFVEHFSNHADHKLDYMAFIKKSYSDNSLYAPARIQRESGVIEVSNSYFENNYKMIVSPTYTNMVSMELAHINQNILRKVNITNKRIHEWIGYSERELKKFKEAQRKLLEKGEEVDQNILYAILLENIRFIIIKKFWWRLGLYGIKERYKYYKKIK